MSKKPAAEDAPAGPFETDKVLCCTCEQNEATHVVYLSVSKSRSAYATDRRDLYSVSYVICGPCAREAVEVKLGATLRGGGRT